MLTAMSSPGHEIQSFFTSYLVLHFPEVWKCGVVRQSKDIVSLSPSHEPFVILYLVLHFPEVWKCGKVRHSKDIVALFPSHEPFVILYLQYPYFVSLFHTSIPPGLHTRKPHCCMKKLKSRSLWNTIRIL